MYIAFAIFLFLHGFAHLVGFAGPWGVGGMTKPYGELLGGRIPTGLGGMRIVGLFWLLGTLAFTAAAVGLLRHSPWWPAVTLVAAAGSLILSILGLPESRLGIPINIVILGVLILTQLSGGTFGTA